MRLTPTHAGVIVYVIPFSTRVKGRFLELLNIVNVYTMLNRAHDAIFVGLHFNTRFQSAIVVTLLIEKKPPRRHRSTFAGA